MLPQWFGVEAKDGSHRITESPSAKYPYVLGGRSIMFLAPLFTGIWVPLMVPHLHGDFRAFGRCFGSIWTLFFVHLDVALGPSGH